MLLDGHNPIAIAQAALALAKGELVGMPTETVYGLGARADSDSAVAKIFQAKGRPADHPLIIHVASVQEAQTFAASWPTVAQRLVAQFWPGPLTVIVPRTPHMGTTAAGGQSTVGLRCPAHPVAQALLQAAQKLGVPGVAAPSANQFGRISPTTAQHVMAEFEPTLYVLDGGPCKVGIESSIVDCSQGHPVLLRPGVLTRAQLEAAAQEPLLEPDALAPRAPGTLAAHYAPRAKLRLMSASAIRTALQVLGDTPPNLAIYGHTVLPHSSTQRHRTMPVDAAQAAHQLFATLRELDAPGIQLIWVEDPPATPEWDGVRDRLQRAVTAAT
jgi:L-threonylcarbamoyladenylate synthase